MAKNETKMFNVRSNPDTYTAMHELVDQFTPEGGTKGDGLEQIRAYVVKKLAETHASVAGADLDAFRAAADTMCNLYIASVSGREAIIASVKAECREQVSAAQQEVEELRVKYDQASQLSEEMHRKADDAGQAAENARKMAENAERRAENAEGFLQELKANNEALRAENAALKHELKALKDSQQTTEDSSL